MGEKTKKQKKKNYGHHQLKQLFESVSEDLSAIWRGRGE